MSKNRIRWRLKGFEEVRRSAGVNAKLRKSTEAIRDGCGEGYVAHVEPGKSRTRGAVVTASSRAVIDNARNNTLLRNLTRGRS